MCLLAGIACGHFGMPFWTFFGATLLGKGVFKIAGQTAFFVLLFAHSDTNIEWVVQWVERLIPDRWDPCACARFIFCSPLNRSQVLSQGVMFMGGETCDRRLHVALSGARAHFQKSLSGGSAGAQMPAGGGSWISFVWSWIIFAFVGYFVVSLVEGIAQVRAIRVYK